MQYIEGKTGVEVTWRKCYTLGYPETIEQSKTTIGKSKYNFEDDERPINFMLRKFVQKNLDDRLKNEISFEAFSVENNVLLRQKNSRSRLLRYDGL